MLPYCLFKSESRSEQVVFSDRIISQLLAVSSISSETRGFSKHEKWTLEMTLKKIADEVYYC